MATMTADSYTERIVAKEAAKNSAQINMDFAMIPYPATIEAFAQNHTLAAMSFNAGY